MSPKAMYFRNLGDAGGHLLPARLHLPPSSLSSVPLESASPCLPLPPPPTEHFRAPGVRNRAHTWAHPWEGIGFLSSRV